MSVPFLTVLFPFQAWVTERMSPTLEHHQSDLVDCMIDQITQMTENLKRCKKQDFRLAIHKMEVWHGRLTMYIE